MRRVACPERRFKLCPPSSLASFARRCCGGGLAALGHAAQPPPRPIEARGREGGRALGGDGHVLGRGLRAAHLDGGAGDVGGADLRGVPLVILPLFERAIELAAPLDAVEAVRAHVAALDAKVAPERLGV